MSSTRDAVVAFEDGSPMVDAEKIAQGLGISVMDVQPLMRSGEITSRCEVGEDKDAGLMRLTFFLRGSRFRIIVDAAGHVLRQSTTDSGRRSLPRSSPMPPGTETVAETQVNAERAGRRIHPTGT
jgi:hypothetical protein